MDKEIAAIYCRLSQDDGTVGESGSIQTQRTLLTQYCEEHHIAIGDYYCDDGWSGTNFQRPQFQRMVEDIEAGKINMVIVKEDCVKIELNQKALENRDFVMWFCFFDPKSRKTILVALGQRKEGSFAHT